MTRTRSGVLLWCVLLVACGSGPPDDADVSTTQSAATTEPSTTVAMAGAVTTAVLSGAAAAEPLRSGAELGAGVRYALPEFYAPLLGLSFVSPIDGAVADVTSVLFVGADAQLDRTLLYVANVDGAAIFTDPFLSLASVASAQDILDAAAGRMPDDFLGWFTSLPGVTFGPIEATEVAGFPARRVEYHAADLPEAAPTCGPALCLTGYVEGTFSGNAYVMVEGERGTAYEVDVNGVRLHIDVADTPESRAAFESLRLDATTVRTDGDLLPQWGPVLAEGTYVGRTLEGAEYTLGPIDTATSTARFGSATSFTFPAVTLPGPGDAFLVDPDIVTLREDASRRPLGLGGDGIPGPTNRPDDLLAGLASHPGVEVIEAARSQTVAGLTVRSMIVRAALGEWTFPCDEAGIELCAWIVDPGGIYFRTDRSTRVTEIDTADGTPVLITLAHLGSVGDALMSTLSITRLPAE